MARAPVQRLSGAPARGRDARDGLAGCPEAEDLLAWMLERFGLDWRDYRGSALERRLPALLRRLRVGSLSAARARLEESPRLLPAALGCLLIGVTEFFRDRPIFEHLRGVHLPEILRTRASVRVLSAGVSDGSELYSVAMLLAEAGALAGSYLLGVDCRADAIEFARAAVYGEEAVQKLEGGLKARYFTRQNAGGNGQRAWRVRSVIARAVEFRVADLFAVEAERPWDMILFRNVGIYLVEAAGARAWRRLAGQLGPGGLLVCGKADWPPAGLPLKRAGTCIYERETEGARGRC